MGEIVKTGRTRFWNDRRIIGWKEWLSLPDLGIPAIKAKIDTGARTSALHTFKLEEFSAGDQRMVRFGIHPLQRRLDIELLCEAPLIGRRRVKSSSGQVETRYLIETTASLHNMQWPIKITLTNRDSMMFRMLLGRTALERRFVIEPDRSYVSGRGLAKSYGRKKAKRPKS